MTALATTYLFTRDEITGFFRLHRASTDAMKLLERWATAVPGRAFDPQFETDHVLIAKVIYEPADEVAAQEQIKALCHELGLKKTLFQE